MPHKGSPADETRVGCGSDAVAYGSSMMSAPGDGQALEQHACGKVSGRGRRCRQRPLGTARSGPDVHGASTSPRGRPDGLLRGGDALDLGTLRQLHYSLVTQGLIEAQVGVRQAVEAHGGRPAGRVVPAAGGPRAPGSPSLGLRQVDDARRQLYDEYRRDRTEGQPVNPYLGGGKHAAVRPSSLITTVLASRRTVGWFRVGWPDPVVTELPWLPSVIGRHCGCSFPASGCTRATELVD